MVASEPFLRSPPFPWVADDVAAVSGAGHSPIPDPVGLLVALREARVGGAFWLVGGRNPWLGDEPVRARPDDDRAIAAWLSGRPVRSSGNEFVSDETLAHATLGRLASASYRDPFTGRTTSPRAAIRLLAAWRDLFLANREVSTAVGMAAWKQDAMSQFLWDGVRAPRFAAPTRAGAWPGAIAFWPSRVAEGFADDLGRRGHAAWAVEDGFLRSNGLGAECHPPMSVIVDRTGGLYFDPSRPSELEQTLATTEFDGPLLERAAKLRAAIVAARLGKYGVDPAPPIDLDLPRRRRVVLAVGQVDDDLSVARGGAGIAGNAAFLDRVRREEPGAFVLYRPHPDVAAGLRRGRVPDPVAAGLVDRVITGGSLLALVERADAVHVLSSLTGFEALLRGREVIVHGQPFYAGWGLTRDLAAPLPRRGRPLSLDALVAGALILTPRYRDPVTQLPCPVEVLVARLAAGEGRPASALTGLRRALGRTRASLGRRGAA